MVRVDRGAFARNAERSRASVLNGLAAITIFLLAASRGLAQADINNGVVRLGVNQDGTLVITPINAPTNSAGGSTTLGLRFVSTNNDGVGVSYNGGGQDKWGVADTISSNWGGSQAGVGTNLSAITFTSTATTAVSTATAGGIFKVTHDFSPSSDPNLYLLRVTVQNTGAAAVNARYRRVIDFDAEPTPSGIFLTIQGSTSPGVLSFTDIDSSSANPLVAPLGANGDIVNSGPLSAGVTLTLNLGNLAPGASTTFNTYYGAAPTRGAATTSLAAFGATVYSLAQPSSSPSASGNPNTFMYGLAPPAPPPPPGQTLHGVTIEVPGPGRLITINTATGAGTNVGPLGASVIPYGVGFRGPNLYLFDQTSDRLIRLDPVTAATIGAPVDLGTGDLNGEGDITFRSDGMGFIATQAPFRLIRFDVTVPNNTPIGPLSPMMDGLAFNAAGVLYGLNEGVDKLYTIDPTTGVATLVGNTGIPFPGPAIPPPLAGLAFDGSGNLFAAVSFVGGPSSLYSVNTATGAATLIGPIGFSGVSGISFSPAPAGVTVTQSGGTTTVAEGGAIDTYSVVLNAAPTANVTITINPGTQLTVAPATLTFTAGNWNTPQTVTVTAVDDALVEGPHSGTIIHTAASTDASYNGIAVPVVTVSITDNDGGSPPPPPSDEGSYVGSTGKGPGPEGEFGFGARTRAPALLGPFMHAPGEVRVLNVAHRRGVQAIADEERSIPAWSLAVTAWVLVLGSTLLYKKDLG